MRRGARRYKCTECSRQFQSNRRPRQHDKRLWNEYVWGKQTLVQLAQTYGHSHVWVRERLDTIVAPESHVTPQPTVVFADTTFWGRSYGVCVFRSASLEKNIWWHNVSSERTAHYQYGRRILEERGWTLLAAVVDGRRGLTTVFQDIPVQICQFHQVKQVTKYLTRRPKTDAGIELRALTLTLTKTDEKTFTKALTAWHRKWKCFIDEKTHVLGTKHWYYTHKSVRSAYYSLKRNLPYLFTYQKYPKLNISNTTNGLDGSFSDLKKKLSPHHGLRRDRRYKVISEILRGR